MTDRAPQLQPLIVLQSSSVSQPRSDGLDTPLRQGPVGKWSESESRTRGMTADPTQPLPADAVADADLWSESAD